MAQVTKCVASELLQASQDRKELVALRQAEQELHEALRLLRDLQEGGEQTTALLTKQLEDSKAMVAHALAGKQAAEQDKAQGLAQLQEIEKQVEAQQQALRAEAQQWKAEAEATKQELEALRAMGSKRQSSLEALVAEGQAREETWQAETAAAKAEAAHWKAQAEEAAGDVSAAVQQGRSEVEARETALRLDVSRAQNEIVRLEAEVTRLTAASDQAVEESNHNEASLGQLQARKETLEGELAGAQSELVHWKETAEATRRELKAAQEQARESQSQAQSSLAAANEEVARWKAATLRAQDDGNKDQAVLEASLAEVRAREAALLETIGAAQAADLETRSSLTELHGQVAALQSGLILAKEECALLRAQGCDQQALLDEARTQGATLREQLASAQQESARLEAENKSGDAALHAQVVAAQEELARCEAAAAAAQEDSSKAQASFDVSLAESRTRAASLERDLAAAQATEAAAQEALAALQEQGIKSRSALEGALSEVRAREAALQATVFATKEEVARWKAVAQGAQAESGTSRASLAAAEEERVRLRTAVQVAREEGQTSQSSLKISLSELQATAAALRADLSSAQGELAQWKGAAATAREEASKLQVSHEALQAKTATAETEMERRKAEAAAMEQKAAGLQASLDDAQAREAQLQDGMRAARNKVDQWKATAEAAQGEGRARQASIDTLLAEAQARETALQSAVATAKEELARVTGAADAAARDENAKSASLLEEARDHAARLQAEVARAKEEADRWQAVAEAGRQECTSLKEDMEALRLRIDEHEHHRHQQRNADQVAHPALAPRARSPRVQPARIFLIETGAWHIRAGWVDVGASPAAFEAMHFPCVVARPKNDAADFMSIVQNAGHKADAMYNRFREMGVFIGKDAWYCAFDHPDPVLRGALKLEAPFVRGRLERPQDLKWLWKDVLAKMDVDPAVTPIAITYKATSTARERASMVELAFDQCEASEVRFLNEAAVLTSLGKLVTALVIDIGEDETRVVPVYEQMVVGVGIQSTALGGGDLTNWMAYMLLSLRNETYSSLVERKMLEVARRIKEKHAYVAADFGRAIKLHGCFEREKIDVMTFHRRHIATEESAVPGRRLDMATMPESGTVTAGGGLEVVFRALLPDAQELALTVGRERFHCGELLFCPTLYPETATTAVGVVDLVFQSLNRLDKDMWPDVLQHVVVAGQTTRLPGFVDRLAGELKARLPADCAACLKVLPLEKPAKLRPMDDSGGGNSDPDEASLSLSSSSSLAFYTTAVSRGVVDQAPKLVAEQENWVDEDVYRVKGPEVLEEPAYS